jgi:hypothetical protein
MDWSRSERSDRSSPLAALRNDIRAAAQAGGIHAPTSKTFLKPGSPDVRIDIEVIKGKCAVPDE